MMILSQQSQVMYQEMFTTSIDALVLNVHIQKSFFYIYLYMENINIYQLQDILKVTPTILHVKVCLHVL